MFGCLLHSGICAMPQDYQNSPSHSSDVVIIAV